MTGNLVWRRTTDLRFWAKARAGLSVAFVLVALLVTTGHAMGQTTVEESPVDRSAQIFGQAPEKGKLTAYFFKMTLSQDSSIEEKSGDSTLLVSPDGKTMLIDGGSTECFAQVSGYLEALGVKRLDCVVATHPHIDHIGGLVGIVAKYPVGTLYMSEVAYPTTVNAVFLAAARKASIPIVKVQGGSQLSFGDFVTVKVLNPDPNIVYYDGYPANSTQFVNNHSLVLKFIYGEASMLFMGDVYSPREAELLQKYGAELAADVAKVGHHGSDTSSSKSFIKAVSPNIAVMMHDRLASLSVYKNYRKIGAAVFLTAIDGCVKVSAGADGIWTVVSQFNRISDFLN
ncbi:MAG: MBL fold metallo-hydrolase [Spirochaetes bacterium]|nr:MBL fold metallo-hydrolase [Spirochaetota bacterium]